jgi:glycosyltransferase involved in cell wall biosynthesis
MKIAILTSSFPRTPGDYQGNFIFYQARGQVENGNEVHVICPHSAGKPFQEVIEGVIVHRFPYCYPYRFQCLSSGGGMYSALRTSPLAMLQLPLFIFSEWWCAWQVIRHHRIDLIHSHWFIPSGLVGGILARMTGKPHIISSHVLDVNLFGRFRFFLPVLSAIIRSADLITTNSSYTKHRIEELVPVSVPCRVIPMGVVLPEPFPPLSKPRKPAILFVGRLVEWKGIDTLIRSFSRVRREIPRAELFIVGEGPLCTSLQDLAEDLNLGETVRFCGRITDEELTRLYDSASVLVLPSRSYKGLVMEGLGVVLLEAMAHGVPVVGSSVGGITDIIEDGKNGFLVPSESEEILAKKIIRLLSDEELAERFRQAGYETVRMRFSWEKISRQFSEVYAGILEADIKKKRRFS